jgi:hypothetical protein
MTTTVWLQPRVGLIRYLARNNCGLLEKRQHKKYLLIYGTSLDEGTKQNS